MREYVTCPMQKGMKVVVDWCELSMHRETCEKCKLFDGREVSNHQKNHTASKTQVKNANKTK